MGFFVGNINSIETNNLEVQSAKCRCSTCNKEIVYHFIENEIPYDFYCPECDSHFYFINNEYFNIFFKILKIKVFDKIFYIIFNGNLQLFDENNNVIHDVSQFKIDYHAQEILFYNLDLIETSIQKWYVIHNDKIYYFDKLTFIKCEKFNGKILNGYKNIAHCTFPASISYIYPPNSKNLNIHKGFNHHDNDVYYDDQYIGYIKIDKKNKRLIFNNSSDFKIKISELRTYLQYNYEKYEIMFYNEQDLV